LAVLWRLGRRWRGPLAGLLFFVGTLLPVLGFCNVFPFVYSYVADHFQYLASLGIITLAAAGIALLLGTEKKDEGGITAEGADGRKRRFPPRPSVPSAVISRPSSFIPHPSPFFVLSLALLTTLAGMTWRQSRMYADAETLYRTTIERNPDCSMAHNNLAEILVSRRQIKEAIEHYQRAVETDPDNAEGHNSLGAVLDACGRTDEAIGHYQTALTIKPDSALSHYNLGFALAKCGRTDEAIEHYRKALKIKPEMVLAHVNLGFALATCGRTDEAIEHYQRAIEIYPAIPEVHYQLGAISAAEGRTDEAIDHYRRALAFARQQRKAALVAQLEARLWRYGAGTPR
jgi:tetratricopeptide (TPR) repeat protein